MEHNCRREELEWETEPSCEGDTITFKGKCPTCEKEYEQVFSEEDGLWDVGAGEYVQI